MFRAQANPMDDAVVKATDENLTSENWELILDVCDRVSANSSGPQQAIAALIKRLAHRNANVQLYTLELANALSQNCGVALHRELASKAFTDALLRLTADRNTHAQVKQKVVERMGEWSEEFRRQPELGIMEQAYQKLRLQQPGLMPPSKPVKKEISTEDRKKEDDELQMALALSIKDKGAPSNEEKAVEDGQQSGSSQPGTQQGTTAATVSRVRALYDFTPSEPGELAFRKNDIIAVLESVYKDWWKGSLRGQTGIFPLNYVEKLQDPTKEELERDAVMEAEVFGEIKNVEKLLALLSVGGDVGGRRGEREEEEISDLYQRTLSIRPKLIELIARYSQKKDDFTQLNEKFIKARRDYEALLETSMAQPQYQQQYPIRQQRHSQYGPPPGQQPQYGGPQQAPPPAQHYSQQAPAQPQGYPPQHAYPQQSQHLPPQQEAQRYYTPAPSEHSIPPRGYAGGYPPSDGQGPVSAIGGPAPFHFIPGGVQAPLSAPNEIRSQPIPQPPAGNPAGPDQYSAPPEFQEQAHANNAHTSLNSGNPSELATSRVESPVGNRHSYPPAQMMQPGQQAPASSYTFDPSAVPPPLQPQHAAPPPPQSDREGLPSRQRTESFDSPSNAYQSQQPQAPYHQGQAPPPPGASAPSGASANPSAPSNAPTYQAYNPNQAYAPQVPPPQPGLQQRIPSAGSDPGDFYR